MSIYMMSSSTDPSVSTTNDSPSDLSLHCFFNDEEILESLTTPEYPWDDMHHHSFFLPEELVLQSDQFSIERKDFIHGKVNCFKNPILAPDTFKEGNMANISTNLEVVEEIMLAASFSPKEGTTYKALFEEFRDIFAWY